LFFRKHRLKLVALALWLVLIGGYLYFSWAYGFTQAKALMTLSNLLDSPYAPLLYILIYALHPLIFFSAAVLGIAGGALFGAGSTTNLFWAVVYTEIGSQSSAHLAYWIGRFFGKGLLSAEHSEGFVQKYAERMRKHSFETVFMMRLLFIPFDVVDYAAGVLGISWKAFALATLVGSFPGTLAFVSFGASMDLKQLLRGDAPAFDPKVFGFSVLIFVVSLVISRLIKKRETLRSE
jgi:uncharacterized membrane protein YdjX (TVP38/TMEM64 family)